MNPVVGLGLGLKLQTMHGLQGIGFLVDEDKEQFVCHLRQAAFYATAALALAYLAFPGLVWRIVDSIGRSKGWQHSANSSCVGWSQPRISRGLSCKVE